MTGRSAGGIEVQDARPPAIGRRKLVLTVLLLLAVVQLALEIQVLSTSIPASVFRVSRVDVRQSHLVVLDWQVGGESEPGALGELEPGDRLLALLRPDGSRLEISSARDWSAAVKAMASLDSWTFEIERPEADAAREAGPDAAEPDAVEADVAEPSWARAVATVPSPDAVDSSLLDWLRIALSVAAVLTAALVGLGRPDQRQAFVASLMFITLSSVPIALSVFYPADLGLIFGLLGGMAFSFSLLLFMIFFLSFPSPSVILRRAPWLIRAGAIAATLYTVLFACAVIMWWHSFEVFSRFVELRLFVVMSYALLASELVMLLVGLISLVLSTTRARGDERRRLVIVLVGTLVGLLPMVGLLVLVLIGLPVKSLVWPATVALSLLLVFPISFSYAVVKHRVLDVRVILRRGIQYALVSRGFMATEAVVLFALFLLAVRPLVRVVVPAEALEIVMLVSAVMTLAAVALMRRVNSYFLTAIDRRFFREAYDSEKVLASLTTSVRSSAARPAQLLENVAETIGQALHPRVVTVFLATALARQLCPHQADEIEAGSEHVCCVLWRHRSLDDPLSEHHADDRGQPGQARGTSATASDARNDEVAGEADPTAGAVLTLPEGSVLTRLLGQIDVEAPRTIELFPGHPELLRRPPGDRRRAAWIRRRQNEVLARIECRLIIPLATADHVVGFISLGERLSEESYSGRDKELMLGIGGQVAMALDYSQLIAQEAEQERLRHEIRLAGEVQTKLLPEVAPVVDGYLLEQLILPAREVAGDFFQFYPQADGDLCLVIGDVSGKGLRAAMLVAHALGAVEAIVQETSDPATVLSRLNELLFPHLKGSGMITCVVASLEMGSGRLRLANAGHPFPYARLGPESRWHEVEGPQPRLPLGIRRQVSYSSMEVVLEPGGALVLMSDGVVEAQDAAGEMIGYERLLELLEQAPEISSLPRYLERSVRQHVGDEPQQDDISVVALARRSEESSEAADGARQEPVAW